MLTFPNITPEVFRRVLDELREHSAVTELPGLGDIAEYAIEGSGIKARVILSANEMVQVTVERKPFYISEGMIRGKIQDAIEKAQKGTDGNTNEQ